MATENSGASNTPYNHGNAGQPGSAGASSLGSTPAQSPLDYTESEPTSGKYKRYFDIGRNKLRQAASATKDSSYYKKVSAKFATPGTADYPQGYVPADAQILLFATYCRHVNANDYRVWVSGQIFAPGKVKGANKMMLRLARHIARGGSMPSSAADEFEDSLAHAIENPQSADDAGLADDTSSTTSTSSDLAAAAGTGSALDQTVTDRMSGVIAAAIGNTSLQMVVASQNETEAIVQTQVSSDEYGMFNTVLQTTYAPLGVEVCSTQNPDIISVKEIEVIDDEGCSVISDVDDTVRVTGVIGDKMDLFRNIFSKPYSECEVPGIAKWYQIMNQEFKCSVHYVSNSPWQLYNVVSGFLDSQNMPVNSLFCKQYFGNIMSSLTSPPSERKRPSLVKILTDFPHRKFFMVGDSGERDIEAYTSLVPEYGSQILAVYIRAVPGSFSEYGRDRENSKKLQKILDNRLDKRAAKTPTIGVAPPLPSRPVAAVEKTIPADSEALAVPPATADSASSISSAESLEEVPLARDPPRVPPKPAALRSEKVASKEEPEQVVAPAPSVTHPPPLPKRTTSPEADGKHHKLDWLNSSPYGDDAPEPESFTPKMNLDTNIPEIQDATDRKYLDWQTRCQYVADTVPSSIDVRFWWSPDDVMEKSFEILKDKA